MLAVKRLSGEPLQTSKRCDTSIECPFKHFQMWQRNKGYANHLLLVTGKWLGHKWLETQLKLDTRWRVSARQFLLCSNNEARRRVFWYLIKAWFHYNLRLQIIYCATGNFCLSDPSKIRSYEKILFDQYTIWTNIKNMKNMICIKYITHTSNDKQLRQILKTWYVKDIRVFCWLNNE